jgi:outer membrane protein assembly factor BamD
MPTLSAPRLLALFVSVLLICVATGTLRADLVWDPQSGWRAEGGVLAPYFASTEGNSAKVLMDKARRAEEAGSNGSALSAYKTVIKKFRSSVFAPEALYRSSGVYEQRRQYSKAFKNLQRIITEHASYPRFREVLGAQYRIASALAEGKRPRYFGVIPGFKQRDKGVENYEVLIANAPYSEYAPLALMNTARVQRDLGEPDAAIDSLDRMINNYPENFLTSDAYLKLAAAHAEITQGPAYDQASTQQALTYYQDYLILYPGEADATLATKGFNDSRTMLAESKMTMGDFYFFKRDNRPAARVFYNEAITIHPDSPVSERARKLLARLDAIDAGQAPAPGAPRTEPKGKRFWFF